MIHTDFADILKCHKMTAILNKFTFTTCFEHVRINDEMHHLSLSFSFVVLPLHSPPSLLPSLTTESHSAPRLALYS